MKPAHVYHQDQGSVETSARKSVGRFISNEDWTHRDLTVCPRLESDPIHLETAISYQSWQFWNSYPTICPTKSWQMVGVSKYPLGRQCNVAIWQPFSFVLIWSYLYPHVYTSWHPNPNIFLDTLKEMPSQEYELKMEYNIFMYIYIYTYIYLYV